MKVSQRMKLNRKQVDRAIRDQAAIMGRQVEAVRRGEIDAVHDMRVASRRLRAIIAEARPMVAPDLLDPFETTARSVTEALGAPRELDVMIVMVKHYRKKATGPWRAAADDAIRQLGVLRENAAQRCRDAVKQVASDAFREALGAVLDAVAEGDPGMMKPASKSLKRRHGALRQKYLEWNLHEDDQELHRVRVAQKKLRYACEFYAPLYGADFKAMCKKLTVLHEVLGVWHDCRVLCQALVALENSADYRAAQGYPLMREAFAVEGRAQRRAWQALANEFFDAKGCEAFLKAVRA